MTNITISPLLICAHIIAMIAILTGLILFIRWAFIALNKNELKTLAIWLIIGGLLISIITAIPMANIMHTTTTGNNMMQNEMFKEMQEHMNNN